MTYEIGYRRPPVNNQFKKGKSGNPQGRPKGSKNFLILLEQELEQTIVVNENGKKKTITRMQAMVKRMVADALQGNLKSLLALVEIMRRTGKFEETDIQGLLPDNYESILDSYVDQRHKKALAKSLTTSLRENINETT
jgi:uncharacterized protein DUF5681